MTRLDCYSSSSSNLPKNSQLKEGLLHVAQAGFWLEILTQWVGAGVHSLGRALPTRRVGDFEGDPRPPHSLDGAREAT